MGAKLLTPPLEEALEFFGMEQFAAEVFAYMHCGHVLLEPHRIVLARAVPEDVTEDQLADPWETPWTEEQANCWYIHYGSGKLAEIIASAPCAKKSLFLRRNGGKLRCYPWDILCRRINSQKA